MALIDADNQPEAMLGQVARLDLHDIVQQPLAQLGSAVERGLVAGHCSPGHGQNGKSDERVQASLAARRCSHRVIPHSNMAPLQSSSTVL
jgi:hypothetical protein